VIEIEVKQDIHHPPVVNTVMCKLKQGNEITQVWYMSECKSTSGHNVKLVLSVTKTLSQN